MQYYKHTHVRVALAHKHGFCQGHDSGLSQCDYICGCNTGPNRKGKKWSDEEMKGEGCVIDVVKEKQD